MKFVRSTLCLLVSIFAISFISQDQGWLEKLVNSFKNSSIRNPIERVYLHLDKPCYAAGDTIWLKAYLTIGPKHLPSHLSGSIYVDLVSERDTVVKQVKFQVKDGSAAGTVFLEKELTAGRYRLRAYTAWMRNWEIQLIPTRSLPVGNPFEELQGASQHDVKNKKKKVGASGHQVIHAGDRNQSFSEKDLQFFPEGGSLLNGILSRLGFKALGSNGRGISLQGEVRDDQDRLVVAFKSGHAGMGSLQFRPEAGRRYVARVTFEDGTQLEKTLPKASSSGFALAVRRSLNGKLRATPNLELDIYATGIGPAKKAGMGLMVHSGGQVAFAEEFTMEGDSLHFSVPANGLPTGIAQVVLLNSNGSVLNERQVFVRHADQLRLSLEADPSLEKARGNPALQLFAKDSAGQPVSADFSVAVIDESRIGFEPADEPTIMSSLLLSSDLKGYVEQPGYYFPADQNPAEQQRIRQSDRALDNLLLCQGYRKVSWKAMLADSPANPAYHAEKAATDLTGRVNTLAGRPVSGARVMLLSLNGGIMEEVTSGADGEFEFKDLLIKGSLDFMVQARTHSNSGDLRVEMTAIPEPWTPGLSEFALENVGNVSMVMKTYLENARRRAKLIARSGWEGDGQRLKEVQIRARRISKDRLSTQGTYVIPEGHSDQTYVPDQPEACPTLALCLQGRIHSVNFLQDGSGHFMPIASSKGRMVEMQLFLDGRKLSRNEAMDVLNNGAIAPRDIAKIEVVRTNAALLSMLGGKPSLMIITKSKKYDVKSGSHNTAFFTIQGFERFTEFYSPVYGTKSKVADQRSTLYWNPKLQTAENGRASIQYVNGAAPGSYRILIEGMSKNGELGRLVYHYKIK